MSDFEIMSLVNVKNTSPRATQEAWTTQKSILEYQREYLQSHKFEPSAVIMPQKKRQHNYKTGGIKTKHMKGKRTKPTMSGRKGGRKPIGKINKSIDAQPQSKKFDVGEPLWTELFTTPVYNTDEHVEAQRADRYKYLATIMILIKNGVTLLDVCKVRALAAAWIRHDHDLIDVLLKDKEHFGIVEVLRAVTILDSGRRAKQLEKKLERMMKWMDEPQRSNKSKSKLGRRIVELKKTVNNTKRDTPSTGTASGALARHVQRWTRTIPAQQLEFFALHLPSSTWQNLADKVHLNPEKHFQLDWFLPYCFDKSSAPADSLVKKCEGLTAANVNDFIKDIDIPWAVVKAFKDAKLTDDSKARIASYTNDLDTLLWDYEDLQCAAVNEIIEAKIKAGQNTNLPYGKLMERLLKMRLMRDGGAKIPFYEMLLPQAENMIKDIKLPLQSPVVVIGDASASMDVAIRTSTIVASFMRALTNADLIFFSDKAIEPMFIPNSIAEVIELAVATKTVGSTCHASALLPYYEQRKVVKTFIIVTDEEENTNIVGKDGESYNFQRLFGKYRTEVYPSRLILISFLRSQHARGQMFESMRYVQNWDVTQFKLDHARPDLTKLNNLVGQLATDNVEHGQQVSQLSEQLRAQGIQPVFEKLNIN